MQVESRMPGVQAVDGDEDEDGDLVGVLLLDDRAGVVDGKPVSTENVGLLDELLDGGIDEDDGGGADELGA